MFPPYSAVHRDNFCLSVYPSACLSVSVIFILFDISWELQVVDGCPSVQFSFLMLIVEHRYNSVTVLQP